MPAADDLPSLSPAQWTIWLGTAVVVHLIWGFHPVFSRWLQTRAAVPVDGLNLLGVCQLFALLVNLAVSRLAAPCGRSCGCGGSSGGPPSKMTATPTTAVARQTFTRERVVCASLVGAAYATRVLHWPIEFPDVLLRPEGGFDVVLGNPPWERIKLQEQEFP